MNQTYPIFQEKYKFKSITDPKKFHEHIGAKNPFEQIGTPVVCIFAFNRHYSNIIKEKYQLKEIKINSATTYWFKIKNKTILLVTNCGVGGAATVHVSEDFIAFGIQNFIIIGNTGGIKSTLKPGDIVSCQKALRDEGVSYHYMKPSKYVESNKSIRELIEQELEKKKIVYLKGKTWTTESMFRETKEEIEYYQKEGITNVDMESASLFALAKYRKVNAGALYVISDLLTENEWKPEWKNEVRKKAIKQTTETILKVCEKLK